ncbi:hypothetical protein AB836_00915 [Rickettsiales bacterium (ex Bugula neritina AB1)]|nr:hypothetical protein AB836_00915 [Rickettsiales bacterium (ex Bugula neritina AB1)]
MLYRNRNIKENIVFSSIILFYFFIFMSIIFNKIIFKPFIKKNFQELYTIYDRNNNILCETKIVYDYYLNVGKNIPSIKSSTKFFIKKHFPKFSISSIKSNKVYLLGSSLYKLSSKIPKNISIKKRFSRYHPYGKVTSTLLGIRRNNIIFGLEKFTDKEKIISSIDIRIQNILYKALMKGYKQFPCEAVHAIIENEKGEVLAIVSLPNFDPNDLNKTPKNTSNKIFQGVYEMGSIIKVFAIMGGVHYNLIKINDIFDISKTVKIGNFIITDANRMNNTATVKEILMKSSNKGMVLIAEVIYNILPDFYKSLLLHKRINNKYIKTPPIFFSNNPSLALIKSYCFGYGFATTPLNILRAMRCICTNNLIDSSIIKIDKPVIQDKIKIHDKEKVLKIMENIANQYIKTPYNIKVMFKTGTARQNINGKYIKNVVNTFFIVILEVNNKKFFLFFMMEKPTNMPNTGFFNIKKVGEDFINLLIKSKILEEKNNK